MSKGTLPGLFSFKSAFSEAFHLVTTPQFQIQAHKAQSVYSVEHLNLHCRHQLIQYLCIDEQMLQRFTTMEM